MTKFFNKMLKLLLSFFLFTKFLNGQYINWSGLIRGSSQITLNDKRYVLLDGIESVVQLRKLILRNDSIVSIHQ